MILLYVLKRKRLDTKGVYVITNFLNKGNMFEQMYIFHLYGFIITTNIMIEFLNMSAEQQY
jgi:hypothetical protein